MKVKPSAKPKKRYVVFEFESGKALIGKDVFASIEAGFDRFFGIWGRALSSVMLLKETYNKKSKRVVVKVGHKYVDELKVAMSLIKEVAGVSVKVKSVIVSGVIKKAKEKV